ncbi:MAG: ATP-binding protein [Clostridia bacterium]|nr:ATP-binding protein [Clostridia bacterium]
MNQHILQKINREFSLKRQRAQEDAARRKEALYTACPALGELDAKAASTSAEYFRGRLAGQVDETAYQKTMADISARRQELMRGADIEPHFECAVCEDTGKVKGGYCKCFQKRMIEENLANANLSVTAAHERFENFNFEYYSTQTEPTFGVSPRKQIEKIYNVCKGFADNFSRPGKNLLLVGTPGLGKTFLSSAIANSVLEQGYTVVYISAAEFCSRVQAGKFGERPEIMEPFYEADLLILDDLGTEFRTQFTTSVLGDVIDRRLRSGKKMVFSSNFGAKELEEYYGQRIVSRFMGGFVYLRFMGDDIRQRKGK